MPNMNASLLLMCIVLFGVIVVVITRISLTISNSIIYLFSVYCFLLFHMAIMNSCANFGLFKAYVTSLG